jgi:hypothetical protein
LVRVNRTCSRCSPCCWKTARSNSDNALDIFLPKIPKEDELLRAALKKAVAIPSKSILFNIDQKADIISKTQIDALLSVFVKVFNEMCGYFGKQGYIAQFERDLDSRDQFAAFKESLPTPCRQTMGTWARTGAAGSRQHRPAYAEITGEDPALAKGILDKYRSQYSVSIEDFGNQVKAWLDKNQPTSGSTSLWMRSASTSPKTPSS